MAEPGSSPSSPRLNAAVAEFFEAVERGQTPDREAILARYADVAGELLEFFGDHDHWARVASSAHAGGRPPLRTMPAAGESAGLEITLPVEAATPNSQFETNHAAGRSPLQLAGGLSRQGIGDYEIVAELGRGGMGVVYKARHRQLGRLVAIKTMLAGAFASEEELRRFQAEAQAAAALDHLGIVPIFESGTADGQPYFAMPLVEGSSLAACLEHGPAPPLLAARLLRKIVEAVAYAHAQGVIHRDLKPGNILLAKPSGYESSLRVKQAVALDNSRQGLVVGSTSPPSRVSELLEACDPKITDFGLAKRLGCGGELTASGQVLGTPSYMPPEQAAGRAHAVGEAADIYALGAILYAMLTGRPPFASDNPVEVILQVLEREPTIPRRLNPGVPRELEAICLKCLEKRPADRYGSAADLAADLDRFLRREPPLAGRPTLSQRLRRWIRRQPVLAAHVAGIGAPLAIAQIVFLLHSEAQWPYHLKVTGVLTLWLALSLVFQVMMNRQRSRPWPLYAWLAADTAMLTALLGQLVSPLGPLVGGYLLQICAAGLAGRSRLVAFTAASAVVAYLSLLWLRPEEAQPLHYAFLAATTLALAGVIVGYQVWRIEVLQEYYDDRRKEPSGPLS